jgi:hypothetical protein
MSTAPLPMPSPSGAQGAFACRNNRVAVPAQTRGEAIQNNELPIPAPMNNTHSPASMAWRSSKGKFGAAAGVGVEPSDIVSFLFGRLILGGEALQ